ncbi:MAG: plasmid pRiA4b ORF-3 family protein [Verrucomicrobiales bacterium]
MACVKSTPERGAAGGAPLYQLKITLKWSKPPIWRRVVVPADMRLDRLHSVIQVVMGWTDSHLHQFIVGTRVDRVFFGQTDLGLDDMGDMLDEKRYTLAHLAVQPKQKFIYEYDFGDSWEHEVVVEKLLPPDPALKHPVCLEGANASPPEDCGGIPGYYNLLEIMADPKHPEHAETKEWLGGELKPGECDTDDVNMHLKRIKA